MQEHQWKLYPGDYVIAIGSNSENIKLKTTVEVRAGIN
jgi:hypothetical protein